MVTFPGSTSGTVWAVPESLTTLGRRLATELRGSPAAGIVESCLSKILDEIRANPRASLVDSDIELL